MNTCRIMRDVFLESLYSRMRTNDKIFLLSADFGSPVLDKLRKDYPDRFINVGIAEQNLINIATGLSLEGFTVYAYGIAAFMTMRPFEQIRVNLALFSQLRHLNINIVGVGAGLSYDVAGPTHHCLEDIAIMRLLPNLMLFSPSDCLTIEQFVDVSLSIKRPKYFRLDSKPLPQIYSEKKKINFKNGFQTLINGKNLCFVSTGYMTHIALAIANKLQQEKIKIGVIDVFLLRPLNSSSLYRELKKYKAIVTMEEGFINKGGLDALVEQVLNQHHCYRAIEKIGFGEKYTFLSGNRDFLHKINGFGKEDIIAKVKNICR